MNLDRSRTGTTFIAAGAVRLAGAEITTPLQDSNFGFREYHARDLEGHTWIFGSYLPNADVTTEVME